MKQLLRVLPFVAVVAVGLGAWQLFVDTQDVSPLLLPSPDAIGRNLVRNWHHYLDDAYVTFGEALIGFALAAVLSIVAATAMTFSKTAHDALNPLQTTLRSMPVVAVAPALVMWLGFGAAPKVLIAMVVTFPPLLVNLLAGLGRVDAVTLEVLRSAGASKREIFWHLRIPHSLPYAFSAAKVCASLALVGAVVGEWAGSTEGLGYRIVRAQRDLETPTVWGATVALGILGLLLTGFVALVERRLLRRHNYLEAK